MNKGSRKSLGMARIVGAMLWLALAMQSTTALATRTSDAQAKASSVHAAQPAAGKTVLLVVDPEIGPRFKIMDQHIAERLRAMGFEVTVASEYVPISEATGRDLIVVSSSVSAHRVEGKFRDIAVPVVTWESYIIYHMRMTGVLKSVDYNAEKQPELNYLWMVNAPHPIAAGIPNGLFRPYKRVLPNYQVNWGRPAPSAQVIATLPGEPDKAVLFTYEKGALMYSDFEAPARRVMFFLHSDTFDELNEAGLKVFDATILWAIAPPESAGDLKVPRLAPAQPRVE